MPTLLARQAPDEVAIVCAGPTVVTTLTRAELDARANRMARYLAAEGLGKGDILTLSLPNGADLFVNCLAAWKVGAIPNPLSPRLPRRERDAIMKRASPRLVISVDPKDCDWPTVPVRPPDGVYSTEPLPECVSPRERALASGGSSGLPKLILAKNPALYDADSAAAIFKGRKSVLVPGPMHHGAPFSAAFQGLFCGCRVVVMHRFDAERCLQLIQEYRVDRMTVVPTMMQRIWKLPREVRERYDVSSLEFVMTGSAPCPEWLMRAWIDWLGADVMHEAFGPSERIGGTFISGREWLEHPGSVGRPSGGTRLKILDDHGKEVAPGVMGEIYVMPAGGTGSTFEYLGAEPKLTRDGWQSVGDMGFMDEEGYLYLGDRRSDLILRGGSNVYPAEVEAAIDAYEGVRSSAVIGLPDEDLGDRVHAIVDVGEDAADFDEQGLRAHLAERLVSYKLPATVELVHYPLRDDAGKLRRSALRKARTVMR
ncbi:MAG: AMP-binding protein, partial [Halioglobus sp.]|nr:AMP-binding protein [Halioglobus sp.]